MIYQTCRFTISNDILVMNISAFIFFFLITFNLLGDSISKDLQCSSPSCDSSVDRYSVRFPFRLPEYQPDKQCSYSSNFTLSCSLQRQTLLTLAKAGSFAIQSINYSSQRVNVSDPNECLPRRFLDFHHLSGSPFSFYPEKHTFYNCTKTAALEYIKYEVPCMREKNHTVIMLYSGIWEDKTWDKNCTVIKSYVSVPKNLYMYPQEYRFVDLYWNEPQCKLCETRGGVCGSFKSGGYNLLECRDTRNLYSASRLGLGIGVPLMLVLMFVAALICCRRSEYRSEEQQFDHPQVQLIQNQTSNTTTGLSDQDIESSNPMFVLREGNVLLEPNIGPCAICLSEYKAGDMLRTIQDCRHNFHSKCLDMWLKKKATCPVCRNCALP